MATRVSVNRRGIEQILHGEGPGGHVHNYVRKLGREGTRYARALAPVRTGRLRNSIDHSQIYDGPRVVRIEWGTRVHYGIYQERGTGIYAGRGYIYPRTAKAFALHGVPPRRRNRIGRRGSRRTGLVFARRVRGVPAQHYLRNSLIALAAAHPELGIRILKG